MGIGGGGTTLIYEDDSQDRFERKKVLNLSADYTGLASAIVGASSFLYEPRILPTAALLVWGLGKAVQNRLGYVDDGCLNTLYADMCISRDVASAFGSLYLAARISEGKAPTTVGEWVTDLFFPALAITGHVLRKKSLKDLEKRLRPKAPLL